MVTPYNATRNHARSPATKRSCKNSSPYTTRLPFRIQQAAIHRGPRLRQAETEPNQQPPPNKEQAKEANCIRVSTKQTDADCENENENKFRRYLPPRSAFAHIQNALATTPAAKDIQVLGV
ncbi:hypothetical protein BDW68DRAFT_71219 [Aspergillus falconensis]